ncbi:(Fe-S)-binding protein [Acetobacterium tundrae]|uniref:Cysteine-rich domain-containing protein n=1 Tax=Acetobacterium tundrae TaxID=132932 RepID=A0ABR6WMS2_9FIRM|nr:(Fe-S)-binding protein [Acetobacterium tundrae]MBC3797556.1 hypothetical protein [Acetobacterium tundrae]
MNLTNNDIKDMTQSIKDGDIYNTVYNCRCCGSCVSTWPSGHRCSLSTLAQGVQINCRGLNGVIKNIKEGKIDFSSELADYVFRCVSCHVCVENCSEFVNPVDYIHDIRMQLVERGLVPDSIMEVFKSIDQNGNVWGEKEDKRVDWTTGLNVPLANEGAEFDYLLFVGDSSAYVPRNQKTAQLFVQILNKLGIRFAILGNEERSSGNEALKMGEAGLFEDLATTNMESFAKYKVKKIIALSPHGYDALKNEYPKLDQNFDIEVLHYTEFLAKLIEEGVLTFTKAVNETVTYHDPCYLGRHNQIYDQPRAILAAIPGLNLVEMDHNKAYSICCGGGGGGIWMQRGEGVVVEQLRYKEALETGVETLVIACPICMQMFEGENENNKTNPIEIKDIIELVFEAL